MCHVVVCSPSLLKPRFADCETNISGRCELPSLRYAQGKRKFQKRLSVPTVAAQRREGSIALKKSIRVSKAGERRDSQLSENPVKSHLRVNFVPAVTYVCRFTPSALLNFKWHGKQIPGVAPGIFVVRQRGEPYRGPRLKHLFRRLCTLSPGEGYRRTRSVQD